MNRVEEYCPTPAIVSSVPAGGLVTPPPPDFKAALIPAPALLEFDITNRVPLLGSWMKEGDLGYLFAPRGAGKSWLAMCMANAVAEGAPLGDWTAGQEARPVVYFDAEMNLADLKERSQKLGIRSPKLSWLSNEQNYRINGEGVNIACKSHQDAISGMLEDGSLFIIDNLSTAQLGMGENDNDSFDVIRDWLLGLRHRAITVLIVHHAGRNGAMRGSSRREDMAHWIISVKDTSDEEGVVKSFSTTFTKSRNCPSREVPPLKWTMKDYDGKLLLWSQVHSGQDMMLAHIAEGVTRATELAELLDVRPGTISKWATRLISAGKIKKNGRDYQLV